MGRRDDRVGLLTGSGGELKSLARGAITKLSIVQLVVGCLAIIAQVVVLSLYHQFFDAISQGIWCGAAFIVCGVIGLVTSRRATRRWVITHLVLCVLACLFSAAIIALSALTAAYNYGSLYSYQPAPDQPRGPVYPGWRDFPSNPYPTVPPSYLNSGPRNRRQAGSTPLVRIPGTAPNSQHLPGTARGNPGTVPNSQPLPGTVRRIPGTVPNSQPLSTPFTNPPTDQIFDYYDDAEEPRDDATTRRHDDDYLNHVASSPSYHGSTNDADRMGTIPQYPGNDYDYHVHDYPSYTAYPPSIYWDHPYHSVPGYFVLNVVWVVQFTMSVLMAVLGLVSGTVAVASATLSSVPLCCDPLQNYLREEKNLSEDIVVMQNDQTDALPIKISPNMQTGTQTTAGLSEA